MTELFGEPEEVYSLTRMPVERIMRHVFLTTRGSHARGRHDLFFVFEGKHQCCISEGGSNMKPVVGTLQCNGLGEP